MSSDKLRHPELEEVEVEPKVEVVLDPTVNSIADKVGSSTIAVLPPTVEIAHPMMEDGGPGISRKYEVTESGSQLVEESLHDAVKKGGESGFLKKQALDTLRLYARVLRHPHLILLGAYHVFKDLLYNLPKSLLDKEKIPAEERIKRNTSQALAVSEGVSIIGAQVGVMIAMKLGVNPLASGTAAAILGSYISSVVSFLSSFVLLAHNAEGMDVKKAFNAALKIERDCLPIAVIGYSSEAPLSAALIAVGVGPQLTAAIMAMLGNIVFTGIAKSASNEVVDEEIGLKTDK